MALFGKLFSKETCIVCGKEVGSLKRKRLADGVICKDCAKQLSPWFDDYKTSTTADIASQLAERQLNRVKLQSTTFSRRFGFRDALLVDEAGGTFCVVPYCTAPGVPSGSQLIEQNPDLIPLGSITRVAWDIDGTEYEQMRTEDGKQVSYRPPRWSQSCNVCLTIDLDHPYIHSMNVQLNSAAVDFITECRRLREEDLPNQHRFNGFLVRKAPQYWSNQSPNARLSRSWHDLTHLLSAQPEYAFGYQCTRDNWGQIRRLYELVQTAEEARAALMGADADEE